jgi:dTDP-4-amino-4,6-dideoxygalactose transaminase
VKFYDIRLDLTPNFDDVKKKIDRKTRAIVAIHYFGFPQPIQKFRDLCRASGLYLIEDCAHVLTGSTQEGIKLGESGDISIYSWRKFLPLYDGGQLVINNPDLMTNVPLSKSSLFLSLKIYKNTFERLFPNMADGWGCCLAPSQKLLAIFAHRFRGMNSSQEQALQVNGNEVEFKLGCVNLGMSKVSRHILKRANITEVATKRRRNYEQLRDAVQNMKGVTLPYPTLPENISPWVFPMLVHNVENFQLVLRAQGIPATTWGGVIHPTLQLREFPDAEYLYHRLIMLPIHQSIDDRAVKTMIEILARFL